MSGLTNIDLLKMDAEHIEFPDASFDAVTCAFGIFYFPRTALAEMYRVCKPGGFIGLAVFEKVEPDPNSPGVIFNQVLKEYGGNDPQARYTLLKYAWPTRFSPEEVESLFADYGFKHRKTIREPRETVYADGEEFWEMILAGGSRLIVMNMDETTRDRFKEDLFDRLTTVMQPDGLHFSDTAIYSIAQK